jgi:hypothetical protein
VPANRVLPGQRVKNHGIPCVACHAGGRGFESRRSRFYLHGFLRLSVPPELPRMVLDEVGGVPILASWWPLCAAAMVHRRDIDGRGVVFGNQGDLYMNAR